MRYKEVKKASIIGIICNLFLFIIKIIIGCLSNSIAMISDAFNSGGDVFSSFMTFVGNKIASKPADEDHNLGHGKAEYIYSMIISIIMILTGLVIIKDSIISIINKSKVDYSIFLIIVCIITIITKFSLFIYTNIIYKKDKNLLIKANSTDHRNDCFLTTCTLISCIFAKYNIYYIDKVVGLIISIWILITSIKIFKQSYDVLMDKAISNEEKEKVLKIVKNNKNVYGIDNFNSIPVGYKYQISFTIFVDKNMTTYDSHKIADFLEKEITEKIDDIYLTIIHVEPKEE